MERDTAKTLIKKALDFADGHQAAFAFQGGEPTLAGIDFFKYFVRTVGELNTKNSPVFFSIQKTGTMITEEWAKFITAKH